jgi:hypothetical protein
MGRLRVLIGLTIWSVVLPLLRQVTDEQVARYIEEHEPDIEALLVSAVEQADGATGSAALAEQVIAQAVTRIRAADDGRRIEAARLKRAGAIAGALAATVLAAVLIGPTTLKRAGRAFLPWQDAAAATPYSVLVAPGDITVPKGGDVEVEARLRGFETERVELLLREGVSPEWQRVPMVSGDTSGAWTFRLFDVTERESRIDCRDLRLEQRTDLVGRTGRADDHPDDGSGILVERHVELGTCAEANPHTPHVAHDSHDGPRRPPCGRLRFHDDLTAERILPRPQAPRQGLVDERDFGGAGAILDRQPASAQNPDAHHRKEVRRHDRGIDSHGSRGLARLDLDIRLADEAR